MKVTLLTLLFISAAAAQGPDLKSLSGGARAFQSQIKSFVQRSAEKMPEGNYAYKPTPEVRSFGEILGHVADAQYLFCSAALGEKNPAPDVEKTKKTKAELTRALQDAFSYCDKAYNALTDANASEVLKLFGRERTRLNVLSFNTVHNFEHYGNLVTYLRLKGVVPPSSEGQNQ